MYVKLSNVEYEIYNNLEAKFKVRWTPYLDEIGKLGDRVYEALLDDTPGLRDALGKVPSAFLHHSGSISVVIPQGKKYSLILSNSRPIEQSWQYGGVVLPPNSAVFKEFMGHHTQYQAIYDEYQELVATLKPVMENCVSLQQLVKVWPSALTYVNEYYRDRFHAKSGKNTHVSKELDERAKVLLAKTALLS